MLIVIEFQSTVDHVMPLRLFQYTGSAWLEWARLRGVAAGAGIPLVLSVLIYGGRPRWTPPLKLAGLMPVAGQRWLATQPRFEYPLLEERRGGTGNLPENNLVTELVAVARARGRKAIVGAVSRLRDRMDEDEGGALDQAVAVWLKSVIADLDAGLGAQLETPGTTREVVEVIKPKTKWAVRWYEDGVDDGREQGIKQGIEQGIVRAIEQQWRLLHRLVERKFGVEAARKLAEASARQSHLDFETVFAAALDCDTADEFMAWMGEHATPSPPTPHATADT
ncbi:MAG: Rpn family recombination-promoting nuclease/putative transposase [Gemmatimonadetes bacterium]|nr:Rpn family recombination-promoting nuclease/putative transposase [Gemmatimonadota bacterium]